MAFFGGGRMAVKGTQPHTHNAPAAGGTSLLPLQLKVGSGFLAIASYDLAGMSGLDCSLIVQGFSASIATNRNNYNPAGAGRAWTLAEIVSTGSNNITGFATDWLVSDGHIVIVECQGGTIVFKDQSANSSVVNRFESGADVTLTVGQSCAWIYDTTNSRWALLWGPPAAVATPQVIQNVRVSTGAVAATSAVDVTVTWPVAFADTNYSVQLSAEISDATNRTPPTFYLRTEAAKKTTTGCVVRFSNNAATLLTWTLSATGIHD